MGIDYSINILNIWVILFSLFYVGPDVTVVGQICKVLSEGEVVTGTVKAVSDVGVFVRFVNLTQESMKHVIIIL